MNAIRNVFSALSNLATSINSLAGVLDVATGKLRQQLALDEAMHALPHGEILDNPPDNAGTSKKNSRVKAMA